MLERMALARDDQLVELRAAEAPAARELHDDGGSRVRGAPLGVEHARHAGEAGGRGEDVDVEDQEEGEEGGEGDEVDSEGHCEWGFLSGEVAFCWW